MGTLDELIEQYKQEAQELTLAPSPRVWENVDREINGRGRKKRFLFLFILLGFLVAWGLYLVTPLRGTVGKELIINAKEQSQITKDQITNTNERSQTTNNQITDNQITNTQITGTQKTNDKEKLQTTNKQITNRQTTTVNKSQTGRQVHAKIKTRPLLTIAAPNKPATTALPVDNEAMAATDIRWPEEPVGKVDHTAAKPVAVGARPVAAMRPLQHPGVHVKWRTTVEQINHQRLAPLSIQRSPRCATATMPLPALPEMSIRYVPEQISTLGYHAARIPAANGKSAGEAETLTAPDMPDMAISTGDEPLDKLPHSPVAALPAASNKAHRAQQHSVPTLPGLDIVTGDEPLDKLPHSAASSLPASRKSPHRAQTQNVPAQPGMDIVTGDEPLDKLPQGTASKLPVASGNTPVAQPQNTPAMPGDILNSLPEEINEEQITTSRPRIADVLPALHTLPLTRLYHASSAPAVDNVFAAVPQLPGFNDIITTENDTDTYNDNSSSQSHETIFIARAQAADLVALEQPTIMLNAQPVAVAWPTIDIVEEQSAATDSTTQTAAEKEKEGKKKSRWSVSVSFMPARNNMTFTEKGDYQFVKNYRDSTDGRLTTLNYALHAHYRLNNRARLDMGLGLNTVGETMSKRQAIYHVDSVIVPSIWTGGGLNGINTVLNRGHYNIDNDSTGRRTNKLTYVNIDAGITCDLFTAGRFTAGIQTMASLGRLVRADVQYYNAADSMYSKAGNSELRPFVWSASLGVMLGYRINKKCSISLMPGYRKYITPAFRPGLGTAQGYEQWSLRMSLAWDL